MTVRDPAVLAVLGACCARIHDVITETANAQMDLLVQEGHDRAVVAEAVINAAANLLANTLATQASPLVRRGYAGKIVQFLEFSVDDSLRTAAAPLATATLQ